MDLKELSMSGVKTIQLKAFHDERGFFVERFQKERFAKVGLPAEFIQDNHSRSLPGVLRGLHFQKSPSQGKLVGVLRGKIWDVVVDLRQCSPSFGKWESVELSDENGMLLWVPSGFAHGFAVLGNEPADVYYKVDAAYSPSSESGIAYNDPDLKINWPDEVISNLIISKKDETLPSFQSYLLHPVFK